MAEAEVPRVCDVESLATELGWTPQQRSEFEAALPLAKTEANVAVAGVTGSGKSTIINALCGAVPRETLKLDERREKVLESSLPANEGDSLCPETQGVTGYVAQTAGYSGKSYSIKVWDSPGVEDGSGEGEEYMRRLKTECGEDIDMLLYCVDMSINRCVEGDLVRGMTTVTQALGVDAWTHAMVVLTFANILEENIDELSIEQNSGEDKRHIFLSRLNYWQKNVRLALIEAGIAEEIVQRIPIEPAGHYSNPYLPDRIHWLGYLWLLFLTYAQTEAKLAILITNQHRIKNASLLSPTDLHQLVGSPSPHKTPIVISKKHLIGASTAITMGVASAVGACVGGVAGGLVVGSLTLGAGVGVGLAAGAAAGAVIGPLVEMAVNKRLQKRQEREDLS